MHAILSDDQQASTPTFHIRKIIRRVKHTMATAHPNDTQTDIAVTQTSLPRADLFDILPALHELLARIDHQASNDESHATLPELQRSDEDGAAYAELAPLSLATCQERYWLLRARSEELLENWKSCQTWIAQWLSKRRRSSLCKHAYNNSRLWSKSWRTRV